MLPGVPAILVLLGSTIGGSCFGLYTVIMSGAVATHTGQIGQFAITLFTVALTFWLWAATKVLTAGAHDYGAATFLAVLVTSFGTYKATLTHGDAFLRATYRLRLPLAGSCALVAANYLYVLLAVPSLPSSFQIYLAVGAAWWSFASAAAHKLLTLRETRAVSQPLMPLPDA